MAFRETFHIEVVGAEGQGEGVLQRISVRTTGLEAAREKALGLFARARVPQRNGPVAEAVRVIDGAGTEVFRWSRFDAAET
ncbi:hypothetical protein MMB17_20575 [Methylobacterium organophilum]|uniref:hypothetical protein n=1 Tax=Methylobacterium organophilum TaxID=410 RepID=UPI001F141049|nr:hypothetical protein [Methylobacterium organophilum]UMY17015.1 hypothetical protein MMB17_20575 [Methylobacterium organophilum]